METALSTVGRVFSWWGDGSELRAISGLLLLLAAVLAAVMLPLWMTGQFKKPICPKGKTLIMMPVGKVTVPECM